MKKVSITLLLAVLLGTLHTVSGQEAAESKITGGFGHFFIGPGFIQAKKINDYLKKSDVLGSSYSPSSMNYSIGGEGGAVLNRFIIGGGGFGMFSPSYSTDSARTMTGMGGGYFKIGYIFYQRPNTFMYGYASFGGAGYSLQVSNIGDSMPVNFNRKYPLQAGKKETYSFGGLLFDLGVSLKTIAISEKSADTRKWGGFMLGVDIGCFVTMPISDWNASQGSNINNNNNNNDANHVVVGPPSPASVFSPYIRLTLGGGGFKKTY